MFTKGIHHAQSNMWGSDSIGLTPNLGWILIAEFSNTTVGSSINYTQQFDATHSDSLTQTFLGPSNVSVPVGAFTAVSYKDTSHLNYLITAGVSFGDLGV